MSIDLVVEMLDNLPAGTTPAERLVLVALAEKADEHTRRVILGRGESATDMLMTRTGLTERGLRAALTRLAARGLDPRVPHGLDHRGRPVFAHQGRSRDYILPLTQGGVRVPPPVDEGGTVTPPPVDEGGTVVPAGGTVVPAGGTVVPPLSLHPSVPNSSAREQRSSNAADLARTIQMLLDPKLPQHQHLDPAEIQRQAARLDAFGWTAAALARALDDVDLSRARRSAAGLAVTILRGLSTPPPAPVVAVPTPAARCEHGKPYGRDGTSGCAHCPDRDPTALAAARAS